MVTKKTDVYFEAVGRRKNSVARVRIYEGTKQDFAVNEKDLESYFSTNELQSTARDPFKVLGATPKFRVSAKIMGGGIVSQSEALRLGIARALVKYDQELRKDLKKEGYLKRDPRVKERKKFGLKKARKAGQWSKR